MPAVVIGVEAVHVDNPILFDYCTSEVARQEPEIRRTDPHIPKDNSFTDGQQHFGMAVHSGDKEDEGDERAQRDAIITTRWAMMRLD